ncbi:MAG: hypothetical protein ABIH03_02365 [Pseudomonadota bacterium]
MASKNPRPAPPAAAPEPPKPKKVNTLVLELARDLLIADLTGSALPLGAQEVEKAKNIVAGCIRAAKEIIDAATE